MSGISTSVRFYWKYPLAIHPTVFELYNFAIALPIWKQKPITCRSFVLQYQVGYQAARDRCKLSNQSILWFHVRIGKYPFTFASAISQKLSIGWASHSVKFSFDWAFLSINPLNEWFFISNRIDSNTTK